MLADEAYGNICEFRICDFRNELRPRQPNYPVEVSASTTVWIAGQARTIGTGQWSVKEIMRSLGTPSFSSDDVAQGDESTDALEVRRPAG